MERERRERVELRVGMKSVRNIKKRGRRGMGGWEQMRGRGGEQSRREEERDGRRKLTSNGE